MRAGNVVILVGLVIVGVGLIIRFAPWAVSWFGNLPGDIKVEGETTRVFVPITSMILVSIVASALFSLIARWLRGG